MPTYTDAPPEVIERLNALVRQNHPELKQAEVTFLVQMVHATRDDQGEPRGPALKYAGSPAAALVSIISLKDRQAGLADVRIQLDGDTWNERPTGEQEAILDHELYHVMVKRDKDDQFVSDDIGRPKLRLRPHDFLMGGFKEIMDRHREHALETQFAAQMAKKLVQMDLPWG